jgi:RecA-family ATPase
VSRYDVAVELVGEGIPVFPCNPDKTPRTTSGFKDATTNFEQVDKWFLDTDALIGVPTGQQFFVVDIDPQGAEWYQQNAPRLKCACINTTRRGWHLAYAMPEGATIKCSASRLAPGVDVRGTGGYVIWWPGEGLATTGTIADIVPPPEWLLQALTTKPNGHDHEQRADDHRAIPDGRRDTTLTSIGGRLRRDGLSHAEIEAALLAVNHERCRPPLPDDKVQAIAKSLGRYEPKVEPEPPAPIRNWINWSSLAGRSPAARSWRIPGWLTNGPTLCAGKGGIGKTLLLQQASTHLAVATPYLDAATSPAKVLMLACEDDHDELWRRQEDICRHIGISLADLDGKLTIDARLGLDNTLFAVAYAKPTWTPLMTELREQVNDTAADVVVIDNIGQTFGGNENDRHHVTSFVNGLVGLRPGISVVLLGHPAKGVGSEFSGSTAWENAVRMRWYMGTTLPDQAKNEDHGDPDPLVRYLSKRKANYSPQDWRRLTYQNGVLLADSAAGNGTRLDSMARREVARAVTVKGLKRLIEIGIDTTPANTSPNYLPKKVIEMSFHEGHGKRELADALNTLLADGGITITTVRGTDRHDRKVLRIGGQL